mmetsp:Transcript_10103/g.29394  ORF Transcript_10103/g.29394 Transcript_10103/m.29394 type:complete len:529 (+) Transcript_10103:156-1742(+)
MGAAFDAGARNEEECVTAAGPSFSRGMDAEDVKLRLLASLRKVDPRAPFLVVSFEDLRANGRLPRSDSGLAKPLDESDQDMRVIFVSHRWMRPWPTQEECEQHGAKWAGRPHPDDERGSKYQLTIRGIETLAAKNGWSTSSLAVWMDYACIDQTDLALRAAGVRSLIGYLFRCAIVLVPTSTMPDFHTVHRMPAGYGCRAWTRLEALGCYTKGLLCDTTPQLYFSAPGNVVQKLDYVLLPHTMPSSGILQEEGDRAVIVGHETTLLDHLHESVLAGNAAARGPALVAAAGLGKISKVKELLDALRQAPDANDGVDTRDKLGITPLWSAARQGQLELTKFLINERANPDMPARSGLGPLHTAAQQGHLEVAAALVEHRADLNLLDRQGNSPLLWAIQSWKEDLVPLLVGCNLPNLGLAWRTVERLRSSDATGSIEVKWASGVSRILDEELQKRDPTRSCTEDARHFSDVDFDENGQATPTEELAFKRATRRHNTLRGDTMASTTSTRSRQETLCSASNRSTSSPNGWPP